MTLYQIDNKISQLIEESTDIETGELNIDSAELDALQLQREEKLENIALYIKNLEAEARAIKTEVDALNARAKSNSDKAERLRALLQNALAGEKMSTPRVRVFYRASHPVRIVDDTAFYAYASTHDTLLRFHDPEPNRVEIARAIKRGETVPGTCADEVKGMVIQ